MKYGFYPGCTYAGSAGYKESTEAVSHILDTELVEIQDWNCCGATTYLSTKDLSAYVLPARVMALAEKQNFKEIVTVCSACYSTLRKVSEKLASNEELLKNVNIALSEEGLHYTGPVKIRHYIEVVVSDLDTEMIKNKIKNDLKELIVAPYYGCQLNRPWGDMDDSLYPMMMDILCKTAGATVLTDYSAKTSCCGAASMLPHKNDCIPLNKRIVMDALNKGANVISTLCPLCQLNVDSSQTKFDLPDIPVIFFTQLLGLAFGISKEDLGLQKLLVPFNLNV
ncbi:MAG: CoB--CoM heterodisulfide reductase iron-sulfur subunit B family protein [Desulfobacterales bacterium]|nr:CoB--CoM heterodisulfide reductase iron-sulfur subunit B family protein [Desulfobacterales bacterium]